MPHALLPFLAVVTVLTLTPGPDMVLVLRNGLRGGSRAAWWTGLGCCCGIAVHASAAVVGLSALLAASATAYTVVKLAGAAYLVYLGISTLWRSLHSARKTASVAAVPDTPGPVRGVSPSSRSAVFQQGLVSNLLNPKIALIFLSLIPQFVTAGEPVAATTMFLGSSFLGLAVLWWRIFSLVVAPLGRLLSRPRVQRAFDRATSMLLVGLGIRVGLADQ